MKKILSHSALLALVALVLPLGLFASTVSFSPGSVSVTVGQMVSVPIFVNAGSDKAYTVKTVVSFPPELLEVRSFSFSSSWLPLSQPGYDTVNNANGTLIKTAGYGGGLSGSASFGTVTFYAKQSGTANVSVSSGTQVLNASNQNTFTGGSGVSVSIAPVPAPVTPVVQPPTTTNNPPRTLMIPPKTVKTEPATTSTTTLAASEVATTTPTTSQTALAYYGEEFAGKNVSLWASLVAVLASFILGFFLAKRT